MFNNTTGIWYREWAPGAKALALVGEFNNWEPTQEHWAIKNEYGVWCLFLPDKPDGSQYITHRYLVGEGGMLVAAVHLAAVGCLSML